MKKKRLLAITLVITLFASIFALAGGGKQKEASTTMNTTESLYLTIQWI